MELGGEVELPAEDHPLIDWHDVCTLSNMVEGPPVSARVDLPAEAVVQVFEVSVVRKGGFLLSSVGLQNVD